MDTNNFEELEHRLAGQSMAPPPAALRSAVLTDVHRELAAARWDRHLARAAAVLLAVGVGMNLTVGLQSSGSSGAVRRIAGGPSRDSLVQVAVAVAEATDPETGSRFARQLAALSGMPLSSEQSAAIDLAVKLHTRPTAANGKDG
jgi:hypothetical protein